MTEQTSHDFRTSALRAIRIERDAIEALEGRIDDHFLRACETVSYTHLTLPTKRIV